MVTRKPYLVWIENWTKDPNWTEVLAKIRAKVARRAKTDKILYGDADRILIESSAPPVQGYGTIAPWALWMISDAHENTWNIIQCAIAANQVSEQTLGWHGISSPNLVQEEWIAICPSNSKAIAGVWKMWGHPLELARVDYCLIRDRKGG